MNISKVIILSCVVMLYAPTSPDVESNGARHVAFVFSDDTMSIRVNTLEVPTDTVQVFDDTDIDADIDTDTDTDADAVGDGGRDCQFVPHTVVYSNISNRKARRRFPFVRYCRKFVELFRCFNACEEASNESIRNSFTVEEIPNESIRNPFTVEEIPNEPTRNSFTVEEIPNEPTGSSFTFGESVFIWVFYSVTSAVILMYPCFFWRGNVATLGL